MIDEVDSASNNQVFIDFLAQLRGYYLARNVSPIFRLVILAGVYDIKNLKLKLRPDEAHQYNSPWNIAARFRVKMAFSAEQIADMLTEYEQDRHTGMDDFFLSEAELTSVIYRMADQEKRQFIIDGKLDMNLVLERFVVHFTDIYGENDWKFIEDYGRKFFLLYLKPIINGAGNYYIEAQTRDAKRTDVIVDYGGTQYVIELKIWHGEEYHKRGERQLLEYLEYYHLDKGYMISFNFNKKKKPGSGNIILDIK